MESVGYLSTWRMILSPTKCKKIAHKSSAYASLIQCLNQWWRTLQKEYKAPRKSQLSSLPIPILVVTQRMRESRTHNTTMSAEEEKREAIMSRFGDFRHSYLKLVIGGLNVFGFAPNLVSLFYTQSISIWVWFSRASDFRGVLSVRMTVVSGFQH